MIVSQPEENLTSHEVFAKENKTTLVLVVDVSKDSIDARLLHYNQT
jgi:transposase